MSITRQVAEKVLATVDAGLVNGVGKPVPGQMCVEAAVCYAMGLPHGDDPPCVSPALRRLKINLNDAQWSSPEARAKGLRRLAVAQLGSRDNLNEREFSKRVARLAIQTSVPLALRAAASLQNNEKKKERLLKAAEQCELEPTRNNALEGKAATYANAAHAATYAAYAAASAAAAAKAATYANAAKAAAYAATYAASAAAYAASAAANAAAGSADESLAAFAEGVVQILVEMNAPGVQWLPLTEVSASVS